jgi:uncharacterized membrane protein
MIVLVAGLVVFLGVHSVRVFADDWRTARIARMGALRWRGIYSLLSLVGFVLLVWGYGQARLDPIVVWSPPSWSRYVTALLVLPAFVLTVASYMPGTRIKARVHHPMTLGIKLWAFAHLLSNGNLADIVLFGSFLVWAIVVYASARRRDRLAGTIYPAGTFGRDVRAVVVGTIAWLVFGYWLHGLLIGVRPF